MRSQRDLETAVRKCAEPSLGVTCFDCHVNEHTSGQFHISPDAQPEQRRMRLDAVRGDFPCLAVSAQVKAAKMSKAVLDVVFLDKDGQWISHHWAAYIGGKEPGDPPAGNHENMRCIAGLRPWQSVVRRYPRKVYGKFKDGEVKTRTYGKPPHNEQSRHFP